MERIIQFWGGPKAVGDARTAVLEHAPDLPSGTMEDLQLLVSEVVTNAVRHGGAGDGRPITLRLLLDPDSLLRVEVTDDGPGFEQHAPVPRSDGGWGLLFVDRLAQRWGVDRNEHTRVWFEMDLPTRGGSMARSRTRDAPEKIPA